VLTPPPSPAATRDDGRDDSDPVAKRGARRK